MTNRYRQLMEARADALVREACTATTFRLDQLSLRYSTEVAAQVIGLTNSNVDGMATTREFISMAVLHLLADATLQVGVYELDFHSGDYFAMLGVTQTEPRFLDVITLRFGIADAKANLHVPLLVSPYSYSTYRGS